MTSLIKLFYNMNPLGIIGRYFEQGSPAYEILVGHGRAVAEKALSIAAGLPHLNPDTVFIREAALLHDIGIAFVHEPRIGCHGSKHYICHGYLGRELLEKEGYPRHALVCERHIGAGLSLEQILDRGLPLPMREMMPVSLEERIICYADKFFSKRQGRLRHEKSAEAVRMELEKFGPHTLMAFDEMHGFFSKKPFREKDRAQEQ